MTGLAAIEWAGLIGLALAIAAAIKDHLNQPNEWDDPNDRTG